jgi:hypothetical protein
VGEEDLIVGRREREHEDADEPQDGSKRQLVLIPVVQTHQLSPPATPKKREAEATHHPLSKSMPENSELEKVMKRCTLPIHAMVDAG